MGRKGFEVFRNELPKTFQQLTGEQGGPEGIAPLDPQVTIGREQSAEFRRWLARFEVGSDQPNGQSFTGAEGLPKAVTAFRREPGGVAIFELFDFNADRAYQVDPSVIDVGLIDVGKNGRYLALRDLGDHPKSFLVGSEERSQELEIPDDSYDVQLSADGAWTLLFGAESIRFAKTDDIAREEDPVKVPEAFRLLAVDDDWDIDVIEPSEYTNNGLAWRTVARGGLVSVVAYKGTTAVVVSLEGETHAHCFTGSKYESIRIPTVGITRAVASLGSRRLLLLSARAVHVVSLDRPYQPDRIELMPVKALLQGYEFRSCVAIEHAAQWTVFLGRLAETSKPDHPRTDAEFVVETMELGATGKATFVSSTAVPVRKWNSRSPQLLTLDHRVVAAWSRDRCVLVDFGGPQ